jgi:Uma2 family endonuclease
MSIVSQPAVTQSTTLVLPAIALPPVRPDEPTRKRWTREEYYRLAEQGWFQNQRVELIDGEIIEISPQSPQHMVAAELVRRILEQTFGDKYWVRHQGSLVHGEFSEPEPDIAVVHGEVKDFSAQHPTSSSLIVEVSRTSLSYDKNRKLHLYASMGVPEYWILDLNNRQLLVYREPKADSTAPFGHTYDSVATLAATDSIAPLEKPNAPISIAAMLP